MQGDVEILKLVPSPFTAKSKLSKLLKDYSEKTGLTRPVVCSEMHKSVGKQRYAYSAVEEEGPGTRTSLVYRAQERDAKSASEEITGHRSLHSCRL